jgi:hypothetical protein
MTYHVTVKIIPTLLKKLFPTLLKITNGHNFILAIEKLAYLSVVGG